MLCAVCSLSWRIHDLLSYLCRPCVLREPQTDNIQGTHKRMVRFQKLTRNLFLALYWHNVYRQQQQLSKISHALPAVRFSCLLLGRGASFQAGVAAGNVFLCAPFWGVQICEYSARNLRCTAITDLDTSKRSTQKDFSCCNAILETGPAAQQ